MIDQSTILNFNEHNNSRFWKVIVNTEKEGFKISQYHILECSKDHVATIGVNIPTNTPIIYHFSITRDIEYKLSVELQDSLYNALLPLKKAKYNDVMQLATNYVMNSPFISLWSVRLSRMNIFPRTMMTNRIKNDVIFRYLKKTSTCFSS